MVSVAVGAGLVLAYFCISRINNERPTRESACLIQPRAGLPFLGVQIICGDCSGEGMKPIKTYMDRTGRCETCGGKSYMLASRRGSEMNQKRAAVVARRPIAGRSEGLEPARSGRLLAFRTSAGHRRAN